MTEQELKELSETYPNGEYNYTTERQAALDYLERVAFPKHEKGVKADED